MCEGSLYCSKTAISPMTLCVCDANAITIEYVEAKVYLLLSIRRGFLGFFSGKNGLSVAISLVARFQKWRF